MFGKNSMIGFKDIKKEFPILNSGITYLDNASTTQKPQIVIDSLKSFYTNSNANVHRGMYSLAQKSDELWINAHINVANFINGKMEEVFFVKNATEGFNWLALTFESQILKSGDVIAISDREHHSNYLPWKRLEKKGIVVEVFEDIENLKTLFEKYGEKLKLVSVVHMSNVLGSLFDIKKISEIAHQMKALVAVDGTQSIAHLKVDVKELDCDFFIFSGHKVYGPNGAGIVYGKEEVLNQLEPLYQGGEMVESVSSEIKYAKLPFRFEAGTPNIADGIALGEALKWLSSKEGYIDYENDLSQYLYEKLNNIENIQLLSNEVSPICAFNIKGIHPHDIASDLGEMGICVRAGYHCVQPLHEKLRLKGSVRVSLGIYNTKEDIDRLIEGLIEVIKRYE